MAFIVLSLPSITTILILALHFDLGFAGPGSTARRTQTKVSGPTESGDVSIDPPEPSQTSWSNSSSIPPTSRRPAKVSGSSFVTDHTTSYIRPVSFTSTPNATGIQSAEQCWSSLMNWRNASAAWYNSNVPGRYWPIGSSTATFSVTYTSTTTFYPSSVSLYTLCDGSPRADVRPSTSHWSGTHTDYLSHEAAMTPTYSVPQPCEPDPGMCRIWYYESNIPDLHEIELLNQCGFPAHLYSSCLLGGGPVQLYYFPVPEDSFDERDLCTNNAIVFSDPPTNIAHLEPVTSGSYTFHPGSAYISFHTLYASYDGFGDRVGPTYNDLILPFASTELSTHCGGAESAFGHGTQLNFADLRWPVPASAYVCQRRCTSVLSTSSGCPSCDWDRISDPTPECNTIWSDVNPAMAVPTRVRDLAPEWKSCRLWNSNVPNYWFDPPVALKPTAVAAVPTAPSVVESTTEALPESTVKPSQPKETGFLSTRFSFHPSEPAAASTRPAAPQPDPQDPVQTSAALEDNVPTSEDPQDPVAVPTAGSSPSDETDDSNPSPTAVAGDGDDSNDTPVTILDPSSDDPDDSQDSNAQPAGGSDGSNNDAASQPAASPEDADSDPAGATTSPDDSPAAHGNDPSRPTQTAQGAPQAPGQSIEQQTENSLPTVVLSILAGALSSEAPDPNSPQQSEASLVDSGPHAMQANPSNDDNQQPHHAPSADDELPPSHTGQPADSAPTDPSPAHTDILVTLGTHTAPLHLPTDPSGATEGIILGSAHLSVGQETTISDVPIAVCTSGLRVGSTFVPLPAASPTGSTRMKDSPETLAYGSLTVTASPVRAPIYWPDGERGEGVSVYGTTLTAGGDALVLSHAGSGDGEMEEVTLSYQRGGSVVVVGGSSSKGTMTLVPEATTTGREEGAEMTGAADTTSSSSASAPPPASSLAPDSPATAAPSVPGSSEGGAALLREPGMLSMLAIGALAICLMLAR